MSFAFSCLKNAMIIRTITITPLAIDKILDKIFKKLLTTNCKNNAAFVYMAFQF